MAKKQQKTTLKNWDEVNEALSDLSCIEVFINEHENDMNEELQKIKEKYAEATKSAFEKKMGIEKNIELFCYEHKSDFVQTRSRKMLNGVVGFMFGKPSVKLLNRKLSWDVVKLMLKEQFGNKYLRTKTDVNKEEIIAAATGKKPALTDAQLADVGIKIVQKENFYCKTNWEELEKAS